ncbi:MAG: TonB family protein [Myxococcaceae bacterium]
MLFLAFLWSLPEDHPLFQNFSEPKKIKVQLQQNSRPPRQLVKINPPREEKIPRKADHVSEFNNSVPKETQAANKNPIQTTPKRPRTPKTQKLSKAPGLKRSLLPSWQDLEQQQEQPETAFNDNLDKKIKTAAQTEVNTFEWKHASYFNRIKESVGRIWAPIPQMRRYDPAGALIGKQDHMTVLEITLDKTGTVIDTQIKTSSGVFYLDDEAIRAFQKASPFPNPPQALFASEEKFSFSFGFVVNVQKGFSLDFD